MTARGGPESDIFVAYASPDRDTARAFYDALVAHGLRVCFDHEALAPGDNWYQLLPDWVRSSSIVAVLLSPDSKDAHYEHSEVIAAIDQARKQKTRLIPVRLSDDAFVPYGTEQIQSVDMFSAADAPALAARIAPLVPARPAVTMASSALGFHQSPDRERILGVDNPSTLASSNNLATTYCAAGDLDRAVALHEANLTRCERILGSDHPDTLTSRNNLEAARAAKRAAEGG